MASLERHNDDQNERRKSGRAKEDEKFNLIDCETDESSLNFDMENVLSSRERQVEWSVKSKLIYRSQAQVSWREIQFSIFTHSVVRSLFDLVAFSRSSSHPRLRLKYSFVRHQNN